MKRNLPVFLVAFVLSAAGLAYWLYTDMQRDLRAPLQLKERAVLDVAPGTGLSAVSRQLARLGWTGQPYYLILEARWRKLAHLIKAGEYAVEPGMSQLDLLQKLVDGRVIQYSLTIPEGLSFREIVGLVRANPYLVQTLPAGEIGELVQQLDYLERDPEGMFYPDTYHFPRGTTDAEFFRRAYRHMQDVLAEEWQHRAAGLPYESPYEALIMASIIEKETAAPVERDRIAGVFVRRLERGMKLQTDPTVIYAMGNGYDGNIRRRDLTLDSPYNTYVYRGLPPTPIAAPGRDAIRAALQPAEGDELYFVSRGDGTHEFTSNLEDHNRAVRLYQLGEGRE